MDNNNEPVTDDAELAKVLDTMNAQQSTADPALSFEATPADTSAAPLAQPADPGQPADSTMPQPVIDTLGREPAQLEAEPHGQAGTSEFDSIKKEALTELRPLVDKLNLPSDEKFNTILLLIRSTDDKTLIPQGYEAAKSIEDETRRAEALLDIIKEIDYFEQKQA